MNPVEDSAGVSDLRARLRRRHLQLQAVGSASWPEDLVTATLNDTVTLLNLQERHAAEAAERERVEGARGIRIVAQAGSAVLGIEVTAAFAGLMALGWLAAFGALLLGTLTIWGAERNQPARRQRSRLTAMVMLDFAAVWIGVVAGINMSFQWALPAVGLATVAGAGWLGSYQPSANGSKKE